MSPPKFALSIPGNDLSQLSVDRNVAFIDYRGMTVHYMPHMPELTGVSGQGASRAGLCISTWPAARRRPASPDATIDLTGLDTPSSPECPAAHPITGKAPTVIALLVTRGPSSACRRTLRDQQAAGRRHSRSNSRSASRCSIPSPWPTFQIKAEAALSGFSLKQALGNVDLTDATAQVIYANSQLHVSGQGKLDGNPADISWREMFGAKVPYRQRYELKGIVPTATLAKAGLPTPEPYVTGPLGIVMSYQVAPNGTGELVSKFDLKGAKAAMTPLGWSKDAGVDGQVDQCCIELSPRRGRREDAVVGQWNAHFAT